METVITLKAKKKMLQARKGDVLLPKIKGIALGNGAIAKDGTVLNPLSEDVSLRHEILRGEYISCEKITDTCYRYRIELGKNELAGESISEAALYDEEGDLLAIRTFSAKKKDEDMEMAFEFDDLF